MLLPVTSFIGTSSFPAQQDTIFVPESYSQYYTKNLLSFCSNYPAYLHSDFSKVPSLFLHLFLPSNIGFQTHTRKNRPAVLTYIDPMIYVSSSPILHIGIWVDQKYRYSQYNFSFFQTNPVLSFSISRLSPFLQKKNSLSKLMLILGCFTSSLFSLSISYKSSIQIFVLTICITLADVSIRDTIPFFLQIFSFEEKHCRDYIIFLNLSKFPIQLFLVLFRQFYFGYYDFLFFSKRFWITF